MMTAEQDAKKAAIWPDARGMDLVEKEESGARTGTGSFIIT